MLIWITMQLSQVLFGFTMAGDVVDFIRFMGFMELAAEVFAVVALVGAFAWSFIEDRFEK